MPSVDDALLVPWAVSGKLGAMDRRLFEAAVVATPALADDLRAARAERDAVKALGEALGRPSIRPLLKLFAAIDADAREADQERPRPVVVTSDGQFKKVCHSR